LIFLERTTAPVPNLEYVCDTSNVDRGNVDTLLANDGGNRNSPGDVNGTTYNTRCSQNSKKKGIVYDSSCKTDESKF
jgi:hypothetical protein